MSATFKPLRSGHGFQSPNFSVDATGNIVSNGTVLISGEVNFNSQITASSGVYADQVYIQGIPLLEAVDSTVSLSTEIKNSSLTTLGVLSNLELVGDLSIKDFEENNNISIVDGEITVTSTSLGSIDNIEIGQTTPANASFRNVNVGSEFDSSILTVTGTVVVSTSATIPTINSTTVNSTTVNTDSIDVDDITINNLPTEIYHATRKDYVDNRVSALSIALGA